MPSIAESGPLVTLKATQKQKVQCLYLAEVAEKVKPVLQASSPREPLPHAQASNKPEESELTRPEAQHR